MRRICFLWSAISFLLLLPSGSLTPMQITDNILPKNDLLLQVNEPVATIPLQLFAYHSAVARALDPDKPRNLAKSVTVK